ncbi:MAG: putative porin [Pseudoalteromonas sp.]
MKKLILTTSLLTAASFSAFAQDTFTSSVSGSYTDSDNVDQYNVVGSYYFSPVSTRKGPLAEAVFLNRSNSINAGFNRSEVDFGGNSDSFNSWRIGGTVHVEDSGLFLNAGIAHANGSDSANYGLGAGYYLAKDWTVGINTNFDEDLEYLGVSVDTKKLYDLGGDTYLNLTASINNPDEGSTGYAAGADYYLNKNLSVGVGRSWSGSFTDGTTALNTNWFFTDTASVSISIARTEIDSFSDNTFSLGASARF